ncbi:hypothetical protein GBA52_016708 [Prunus armeniaca]|nr:hypothetical protein GBA52_016708 [Prunus armeniaca]
MATTLKLQPPNPSHNHSPPKPIQQPPSTPGPMNPKPSSSPPSTQASNYRKRKEKNLPQTPSQRIQNPNSTTIQTLYLS